MSLLFCRRHSEKAQSKRFSMNSSKLIVSCEKWTAKTKIYRRLKRTKAKLHNNDYLTICFQCTRISSILFYFFFFFLVFCLLFGLAFAFSRAHLLFTISSCMFVYRIEFTLMLWYIFHFMYVCIFLSLSLSLLVPCSCQKTPSVENLLNFWFRDAKIIL